MMHMYSATAQKYLKISSHTISVNKEQWKEMLFIASLAFQINQDVQAGQGKLESSNYHQ